MAALATTDDLTARGITVADEPLAELYLGVASAAVRDAAGCQISQTTSTVTLYPSSPSPYLALPGGPVTAVTSVEIDGRELTQGLDYALWDGSLYRPCGWLAMTAAGLPAPVVATYPHGLVVVPEDIVDLVCRMAATAVNAAGASKDGSGLAIDGVVQESLGDYAVTYRTDTGLTEMELSASMRSRLRARFGGGTAMVSTR